MWSNKEEGGGGGGEGGQFFPGRRGEGIVNIVCERYIMTRSC